LAWVSQLVLGSLRYSLYQGANASHEGFPLWGRSAINGDGFSRKVLGGRGEKKHGKKSNATLAPQADTGLFGGIFIRFFFHPRDRVYHLALGGKKSCKFICHLSAWVAFNFFNSTFRLEAARPSFPENEQILVPRVDFEGEQMSMQKYKKIAFWECLHRIKYDWSETQR
jgi:hypothetical protein